jgi:hypothetical protein
VCLQEFCHICGKRMYEGRCNDCDVDNTWTSWFRPYRSGSFRWITYCPGCGVELDTSVRRWRAGD